MSDLDQLAARLDSEFNAAQEKLKSFQSQQVQAFEAKQHRLQQLDAAFHTLRGVWLPRLELLVRKFGERVQVKPTIKPGRREAVFDFQSPVATVKLTLSASTDADVTKLVLDYELDILPILQQFDRHAVLEQPLDAIDAKAVGAWLDDRIVSFVKTYLSLQDNEYYLKGHMTADPVTGIRFPTFAAAATLEKDGKTLYFISDDTKRQYESGTAKK